MESRRFRIIAEGRLKTCLFCRFVFHEGGFPVPGSSLDRRNLTELIMKNLRVEFIGFNAVVVSQRLHLISSSVSLYRSMALLIRC